MTEHDRGQSTVIAWLGLLTLLFVGAASYLAFQTKPHDVKLLVEEGLIVRPSMVLEEVKKLRAEINAFHGELKSLHSEIDEIKGLEAGRHGAPKSDQDCTM